VTLKFYLKQKSSHHCKTQKRENEHNCSMPARGAKRTRSEKNTEAHTHKIPDFFTDAVTNISAPSIPTAQKNPKRIKSAEARAAVRGAKRALEFANTIYGQYISSALIDEVEGQLDEIDENKNTIIEEYDDIIKSLKAFEMYCKTKYTEEANETMTFFCAICLVNQPINTLQLLVPCGHGFCNTCISKMKTNNCPNCRRVTDSVLKAYV
jgi:hypothetical protein